jgi:hypothetical protein
MKQVLMLEVLWVVLKVGTWLRAAGRNGMANA